jgi:hypothetical protein
MTEISINNIGCVAITPELAAELSALGEDVSKLNRMDWPAGASRYARGVFLMYSEDAQSLAAGDRTAAVTLVMSDDQLPGDSGMIRADKLYQIEHRPIHTMPQSQSNEPYTGLYAVTLVDERYFWSGIIVNAGYNVTSSGDRSVYYTSTKNGGSAYTWNTLVASILSAIGITSASSYSITEPSGPPTDYLVNGVKASHLLDRVCAALGYLFVALPAATGAGIRYQILQPSQGLESNGMSHNGAWITERIAGGTSYQNAGTDGPLWLNAIMPSSVTVLFPRQIPSTTVDNATSSTSPPLVQFYTATSTSGKPSGVTGRTGYAAILNDSMWAIGPIGAETNATALQTRADELSGIYYQRWQTSKNNVRLRGWENIGPVAGDVTWRLTMDGPYTEMMTGPNLDLWGGTRDVIDGVLDKPIVGLGVIQTHKTFDGGLIISSPTTSGSTPSGSTISVVTNVSNIANMTATVNKQTITVLGTGATSSSNISLVIPYLSTTISTSVVTTTGTNTFSPLGTLSLSAGTWMVSARAIFVNNDQSFDPSTVRSISLEFQSWSYSFTIFSGSAFAQVDNVYGTNSHFIGLGIPMTQFTGGGNVIVGTRSVDTGTNATLNAFGTIEAIKISN